MEARSMLHTQKTINKPIIASADDHDKHERSGRSWMRSCGVSGPVHPMKVIS